MSHSTQYEVMCSYFDELLSENTVERPNQSEAGTQAPSSIGPPSSVKKQASAMPVTARKRCDVTPLQFAEHDDGDSRALEDDRRQQLQQMLASQNVLATNKPSAKKTVKDVDPTPLEISKTSDVTQAPVSPSRPVWAEGTFEVLLFTVFGLTMAVPLVSLGQILPLDRKLVTLSGQSRWFAGVMPSVRGDIRVVNTAEFVMPERYDGEFADHARYVITIADHTWGLAVDEVDTPQTISPERVKWRSTKTSRQWLAGTVMDLRCALIDVSEMAKILSRFER